MPKILAIDDKNDNLISLQAILKDIFSDAIVFTALTGPKGIELAFAEDPDIILLDVVMPGMDGFEVCRRLKEDPILCEIPVVFLTALQESKENRHRALEIGAEAFLSKPIDETELTAQIRAMLKIKSANNQKRNEKEHLAQLVSERTMELEQNQIETLKLVKELKAENKARREIEEELRQSEATIKNKLKAITEPDDDIGTLELSDIIDTEVLQSMMDNFYELTGMLGAVLDVSGKVLVAVGWQDICTKFHRCNPDTLKNCLESDTILTNDVHAGTFKAYKCKNNLWDMVTPIMLGDRHVGNVFIGQFFYEDEVPDVELFRKQASKYGFNETEYLSALDRVPRFSKETVKNGMQFYAKLAGIISSLSFSTIQQSRLLAEQKLAGKLLKESEVKFRALYDNAPLSYQSLNEDGSFKDVNPTWLRMLGYRRNEIIGKFFKDFLHPDWRSQFEDNFPKFKKRGFMHDVEFKIEHKTGHYLDILFEGCIGYNPDGSFKQTYCTFKDITKSKRVEEEKKIYHNNIETLSKTAMKFVEFQHNNNIYDLVGEQIREFVGKDSYIIVNSVDCKTGTSTIHSVLGISKLTQFITNKLGRNPVGMKFDANDPNLHYKDGKLHIYNEGIYGLLLKTIPKSICKSIEDLANIKKIYVIDLAKKEQFFGSVIICVKDATSEIKNKQLIETFIQQASIAILKNQAEEALAKNQVLIAEAQRTAKLGGFDFDVKTKVQKWTEETFRIMEVDFIDGAPDLPEGANFIAPEYRPMAEKAIQHAIEHGEPYKQEWEIITAKGNRKWVLAIGKANRVNGITKSVSGSIQDITETKNAEIALAAEKERLEITLRSIGDGVITTDKNGNITMLNNAAEEMTGWSSPEAVGRPLPEVFNIINEITKEQCENPFEKVLATGCIVEMANQACLLTKDGREIIIADTSAPILDQNRNIIGIILVFRDMSVKQKLINSIQKSQKLEALGLLAGGIAHDFNNLMASLFGYIDLASEKTNEPKVSSYLAKASSTIDRARALTQQLLTFAKGGTPIKKIESLFPFAAETAQFALSGSTISCIFDVQENLWPCDIDKNQIGQVIDNLIINAQQAMPGGGEIEVSAQNISLLEKQHTTLAAGNYVKLSIKDQGIGIPKEFLPSIFDPFYTTKPKGHGLGLSTCYSIVTRHGGIIDVESQPGKGTTFHIYLPASEDSVSATTKESISEFKGTGTFLIMDDVEGVREIIGDMLETIGYSVVLKENGEDAVAWFAGEIQAKRTLAGMIFDLTIPGGMGGREAIGEIRKLCLKTPVFVASGYADDPVMSNPKDYGFSASICKPFKREELIKMLSENII